MRGFAEERQIAKGAVVGGSEVALRFAHVVIPCADGDGILARRIIVVLGDNLVALAPDTVIFAVSLQIWLVEIELMKLGQAIK